MRQRSSVPREYPVPRDVYRCQDSDNRGFLGCLLHGVPALCILTLASACLAQATDKNNAVQPTVVSMPDAPDRAFELGLEPQGTGAWPGFFDSSSSGQAQAPQPDSQSTLKKPEPQNPVPSGQPAQTKRILGIIPNFRSVSTSEILPPQSAKEKFLTATDDSFDYSSVFIPALLAVYSLETDADPEFGHGGVGYGRYFWHAAVDQTSENYMVEFVVPVMTHEDTRYYTLGHGGFFKRTGYALSRAVVTRSDSAHEEFNFSEVVGAGASAGLSSLYYPTRERSLGNTGTEWGIDIGIDAASFVVKEFWPDINSHLFHRKDHAAGANH